MLLALLVCSFADNALAGKSQEDLAADELPLESSLAAVPLLDDGETVHVAIKSWFDFASVHRGDVLFDAGDEENVRGFDRRLGVYPDAVSFLKWKG